MKRESEAKREKWERITEVEKEAYAESKRRVEREMKSKRGREEVKRERGMKKEKERETKGKRVQYVERSKDRTIRWMDKTIGETVHAFTHACTYLAHSSSEL